MKNDQRCLVASVIIHGTLLGVLVFAPGFTQQPPAGPVLVMVPTDLKLTDGDKIGGGNPNAQPPKAAPQVPPNTAAKPPESKPEPVKPLAKPVEPEPEPKHDEAKAPPHVTKPIHVAPEPLRSKPEVKSQDTDSVVPSKPLKKPIKPSSDIKVATAPLKRSKLDEAAKRQAVEEAAAEQRRKTRADQIAKLNEERQRIANSIGGAAQAVGKSLAGTTTIEMPGPGGQAYAPYGSYLGAFYKERWRKPSALSARSAYVVAEVEIARDGRLVDWRLAEKSGQRELDDSVSDVLRRYPQLRALPDGTTDAKRTFRIKFTLEADTNT